MRLIGDAVKDLSRHFIQYWNFAKISIATQNNKKKDVLEMTAQMQNDSDLMEQIINVDEKNGNSGIFHGRRRMNKEKSLFDRMKTSLATAFKKNKDIKLDIAVNNPSGAPLSTIKGKRDLFNVNQIQTQLTQKFISIQSPGQGVLARQQTYEARKSIIATRTPQKGGPTVPEDFVEGKLRVNAYFEMCRKNTFFPDDSNLQQGREEQKHHTLISEKDDEYKKSPHESLDFNSHWRPYYNQVATNQKEGEESLSIEFSDLESEDISNKANIVATDIYRTKANIDQKVLRQHSTFSPKKRTQSKAQTTFRLESSVVIEINLRFRKKLVVKYF
jgi:hypothetical protein